MATATNVKTVVTLLALLLVSVAAAPMAAAAVTLTTSKTKYNPGDTLSVSGEATPNSAVTLKVYNPSNNLVAIGQSNTNAQSQYSFNVFTWPLTPTLTMPFGIYSITLTDAATGEITDTTVEYVQLVTPPASQEAVEGVNVHITVSTGSSYQLGDNVRVFTAFSYNGTMVDPTATVVLVHPPGITATAFTLIKVHTGLYYFEYTPDSIGTYAVHIEASARGTSNFEITTFKVTEKIATANGLTDLSNTITAKIDTSQQAIIDRIASAQSSLNGAISSSQSSLNTAITNAQNDVKTAVSNAQTSLSDDISSSQNAITSAITTAQNSVNDRIDSVRSDISSSEDSIKSDIASSEQEVKDAISGIQSAVTSAVNGVVQPLRDGMTQVTQTVATLEANLTSTEEGVSAASTWILVVGIIAAITLVLELVILIRKLS